MQFLRNRIEPMPPSLLMFAAIASGVVIGRLMSLPISDQVPELMMSADEGLATGAAAKALAVSWAATAISFASGRPVDSRERPGQPPHDLSRGDDLGHDPRRDAERREDLARPRRACGSP